MRLPLVFLALAGVAFASPLIQLVPRQSTTGSACTDDSGCASTYCYQQTCRNPSDVTAQLGEPCQNGNCDSGLECDSGTCSTVQDNNRYDGESCDSDDQCSSGMCGDAERLGDCIPSNVSPGEGCDESQQCTYLHFCDSGTCTPMGNGEAGSPCEVDENCTDNVCFNGTCGEPDDRTICDDNTDCPSGQGCDSGYCVESNDLRGQGEECSSGDQCQSGRCVNDVCGGDGGGDNRGEGESCQAASQCMGGFCLSNVCRSGNKDPGVRCTINAQCKNNNCTGPSGSAVCATNSPPPSVPAPGPSPPANNNDGPRTVTTTVTSGGTTRTIVSVIAGATARTTTGDATAAVPASLSNLISGLAGVLAAIVVL